MVALQECNFRIILVQPTAGVDFGVQQGSRVDYLTIQKQRSEGKDLTFEFKLKVKQNPESEPVFLGAIAQGSPKERFVYLDIGRAAGQVDSIWSRRLKIPLKGISWEMIQQLLMNDQCFLEMTVPGIGRDGGPNCATFKSIEGWKLIKN
jgi:hypothetical protein